MTPNRRLALGILLTGTLHLAPAVAVSVTETFHGYADLCYLETRKAVEGTSADQLSVAACNRALHFQRLTREGRSIAFHNRGVIELSKGDADAARTSFERAVQLSRTVDLRHLALAQLAHQQGDYEVAIAHYDALIEAAPEHPVIAGHRDILERNRDRARRSLQAASFTGELQGLAGR